MFPLSTPAPDFTQLRKVLLRQGKPRYVPFYELFVNLEVQEALLDKKIPDQPATVEFYYRFGYDHVPVWPLLEITTGDLVDTRKAYPIRDWATFERFSWPRPEAIDYSDYEKVGALLPEGMAMTAQYWGVFEMAQLLLGYQGLCYLLADDRALVKAVFDHIGVWYEVMYRNLAAIEKVGALVISDDMGYKTQTLIGVPDLREFVLPWHKRLAQIAHAAGKPVILHSCGQLSAIMEDIIEEVGIDAKHSYEDAITPVTEAKKLWGNRLAILGGFDVDRLCRSSPEEIRRHTRRLVAALGADGGYALGSGNSIAPYVPLPHYLAMLEEGWQLRSG
jgi:uroporphyrinogen decarboxylase